MPRYKQVNQKKARYKGPITGTRVPKVKGSRFGANEKVDAGLAERTAMRVNRLRGVRPHGINVSDGVTGREARLARDAVANERSGIKAARYAGPGGIRHRKKQSRRSRLFETEEQFRIA